MLSRCAFCAAAAGHSPRMRAFGARASPRAAPNTLLPTLNPPQVEADLDDAVRALALGPRPPTDPSSVADCLLAARATTTTTSPPSSALRARVEAMLRERAASVPSLDGGLVGAADAATSEDGDSCGSPSGRPVYGGGGPPSLLSPGGASSVGGAASAADWWSLSTPSRSVPWPTLADVAGSPAPPPAAADRLARLARPRGYDWVAVQAARAAAAAEAFAVAPPRPRAPRDGPPIERRLAAAAAARAERLAAARAAAAAAETEGCTFSPAVTPHAARLRPPPLHERAASIVAAAAERRAAAAVEATEGMFEPAMGHRSAVLAAAVRAAGGPRRRPAPPPPDAPSFEPALNAASVRLVEASTATPSTFEGRQQAAAGRKAEGLANAAAAAAAAVGATYGATTETANGPPNCADGGVASKKAEALARAADAGAAAVAATAPRAAPATDALAAAARARQQGTPPSRVAALAAAATKWAPASPARRRAPRPPDVVALAASARRAAARRAAAEAAAAAAADADATECTFAPWLVSTRPVDPAPADSVATRVAGAGAHVSRASAVRAAAAAASAHADAVFHAHPRTRYAPTQAVPFDLATEVRGAVRGAASREAARAAVDAACPFVPATTAEADKALVRELLQ